jgi:hypothetical protein
MTLTQDDHNDLNLASIGLKFVSMVTLAGLERFGKHTNE